MNAAEALRELTEISSQIESAVLVTAQGQTLASTLDDDGATERLSAAVRSLLETTASSAAGRTLVQLEAATGDGSLFVVCDDERVTAAAAEVGDGKPRPRARTRAAKVVEAGE